MPDLCVCINMPPQTSCSESSEPRQHPALSSHRHYAFACCLSSCWAQTSHWFQMPSLQMELSPLRKCHFVCRGSNDVAGQSDEPLSILWARDAGSSGGVAQSSFHSCPFHSCSIHSCSYKKAATKESLWIFQCWVEAMRELLHFRLNFVQLERGQRFSLHKEPHEEDKGGLELVLAEVSSWIKKEICYRENNQSMEPSPEEHREVPITKGFQHAVGQGAR